MNTQINTACTKLWKDLKKGNLVALGKLYDLYIDELFQYGIQATEDKAYVMDCIHDLFLDIYKYRATLADTDNVAYYLFKSLKRKLNRKYKSKEITVSDVSLFSKKHFAPSLEENIILEEYNSEKKQKLKNAFHFLTNRQKEGITLRYSENRPYEEIAEILNVSVQTSRTIIYRGIKVLREHLTLLLLFSNILI